ncbi:MAG: AAA family ATPase [Caldilineaceae bacterium]|nr:AAA family ATPase [Caldilineaceae bacterium]
MLEEIWIRNYRIFNELRIDQFGRINLIAGNNNSGKTSLLEAIFLLAGGRAELALNGHISRVELEPGARLIGDNFWKPFFSDLDMENSILVEGLHTSHGHLSLEITSGRQQFTDILLDSTEGAIATNSPNEHTLFFKYTFPSGQTVKSHIQEIGTRITGEQPDIDVPFKAAIVLSRFPDSQEDARRLSNLRKQKREHFLLEALRVIEPKLQSIEENSASGTPMIWGDIGLPELIPLAIMGEGMSRIARLVLAVSAVGDGIVMVDELENGLHHSVLPRVWLVLNEAAKQFNTQIFATTHSFECVRAAHNSLAGEDFRLHRLEESDDGNRCITYDPETIAAALEFNLEVR